MLESQEHDKQSERIQAWTTSIENYEAAIISLAARHSPKTISVEINQYYLAS